LSIKLTTCRKCKGQIKGPENFCPKCGTKISSVKAFNYVQKLRSYLQLNSVAIVHIEKDSKGRFTGPLAFYPGSVSLIPKSDKDIKFCTRCETKLLGSLCWQYGAYDDETYVCDDCFYYLLTNRDTWIKPMSRREFSSERISGCVVDLDGDCFFIDKIFEIKVKKKHSCVNGWLPKYPNCKNRKDYLSIGTDAYQISQFDEKSGEITYTLCEDCMDTKLYANSVLEKTKNLIDLERDWLKSKKIK
jgi:hypothetical protein